MADLNALFRPDIGMPGAPVSQLAPQPTWADAATNTAQNVGDYIAQQRALPPQSPAEIGGIMANALLMGTTAPGIRAFHGSPYDFNAFDTAKIGTGEGAQAYGHGLYFAEREGIAKQYRDDLTEPNLPTPTSISGKPTYDLWNKYADPTGAMTIGGTIWHGPRDLIRNLQQGRTTLEGAPPDLAAALQSHTRQGHMYEVNIGSDPAHFLDWDKPLSEQSPHVKEALAKVPWAADYLKTSLTGGQIVPHTAEGAQQLRDAGIPGIRYADQGSRWAQDVSALQTKLADAQATMQAAPAHDQAMHQRYVTQLTGALDQAKAAANNVTRNTVVFDPATIEILRKYGIAGLMAGGGAAATTQGQQ